MRRQVEGGVVKWSTGNDSATTNISTGTIRLWGGKNSFQVNLTGTGSVSVTATPQFSNDGVTWISGTALNLSGTNSDTDGVTIDAAWKYARITLSSITGTSATVQVYHAGLGA